MITVKFEIKGQMIELSVDEARKLYNELDLLFNVRPCSVPIVYPSVWPSEPIWPPWSTEPYYSPGASGTDSSKGPTWAT
jgi:hypothetical protein